MDHSAIWEKSGEGILDLLAKVAGISLCHSFMARGYGMLGSPLAERYSPRCRCSSPARSL
jgi:hypothetical protein